MSDPQIREFRLAKGRPDGVNPFLSDAGAFLGDGTPLLERDAGGRWRPRLERDLDGVLAKSFGASARIGWRMDSLASVAKALNRGDRSLAAIALVQTELPPFAKINPDVETEPRDENGRWTRQPVSRLSISAGGRKFIQMHESVGGIPNLKPYGDIAEHPTIGWGHEIGKDESYPDGISREKAEELFNHDIAQAEALVRDKVKVPLSQNEYDAMVSFAYNFGPKGFQNRDGSQTQIARILNAGNYVGVANRLMEWNHADGKVNDGLTNRRTAERKLFLEGGYQ